MGATNEIIVGLWSGKQPRPRRTLRQRLKGQYCKPCELIMFETEYNLHKYDNKPNVPEYARVWARFRDDTANELTKAIIAHLKHTGNFGARVNTTGLYDSKSGLYRQTNARKGMADISAVIAGVPVQIEIKAGRDKPRAEQLQVQAEYREAGGMYEFVQNFPQYVELYKRITGNSDYIHRLQPQQAAKNVPKYE